MELKDFVAVSLKQIAEGIKEAQDAKTGAYIAPLLHYSGDGSGKKLTITDSRSHNSAQSIAFDIAVTAAEDSKNKGGMGLKILMATIGGELETSALNSTVTRIRFEVPIVWPVGENPWGR